MPQEILDRFQKHDRKSKYRGFDDPNRNMTTQTAENPQSEGNDQVAEMLEAEIGYQRSLMN